MRIFFTSLLSATLGALLVLGAFTISPPDQKSTIAGKVINATAPVSEPAEIVDKNTLTAQEVYEQYGSAVVHVKASVTSTYNDFFGLPVPDNRVASGSGFVVSKDGYVITNAHVVSGADEIAIQFSDQTEKTAVLIGIDQSSDLAVLKTDLSGHTDKVLDLGDSKAAKVGQTVYAIGNPLGYDRSMSRGIISATNRVINAPNGIEIRGVVQTDAAVNRGNSGGPLLSATGEVIGVTSQIATTGQGNIGIAFAIPSSIVKRVFSEIKKNGKTSRPWIGIRGTTLRPAVAKEMGLKVESGALIVSIIEPGPAEDAGLLEADRQTLINGEYHDIGGDVITKINKTKIESMEDLVNEVNQFSAGEKITVTIARNKGPLKKLTLTLVERPAEFDELRIGR